MNQGELSHSAFRDEFRRNTRSHRCDLFFRCVNINHGRDTRTYGLLCKVRCTLNFTPLEHARLYESHHIFIYYTLHKTLRDYQEILMAEYNVLK